MLIQVTQEDIDEGERGHCYYCPVALAIGRTLNRRNFIYVGGQGIRDVAKWVIETLPPGVLDFVCKFDNGEPVSPFSFELEIPK